MNVCEVPLCAGKPFQYMPIKNRAHNIKLNENMKMLKNWWHKIIKWFISKVKFTKKTGPIADNQPLFFINNFLKPFFTPQIQFNTL